ncbi:MAG: type II secretion system F family protein [Deltaproteobacteria bacterium]
MQTFAYKARDAQGKLTKGVMPAESSDELYGHLKKLGYFLTEAKPVVATSRTVAKMPAMGAADVMQFTTQLAISVDSGLPLLASLKELARTSTKKNVRFVLEDVARRIESGTNMREALAQHPRSFSLLYISIIEAGESTGKLPVVLNDLAKLLEWQMELQAKIQEASIYPAILFLVMVSVVGVMIGVVIPKFKPMLEELGTGLPVPTMIILSLSTFLQNFWWLLVLLIGGSIGGYMWANSQEKGRYEIDKIKLSLPVFGDLINKVALSRFCHTFALSLKSGVNVFSALGIASHVVDNKLIEVSIVKAKDYVNVGEKISTSLELASKGTGRKFPDIVIRMIQVGEQSGSLAETMEKVNQYYDKEVPTTVRKIFAMLEPMMIVVMGLVVAGIALAVFLPMMQMITAVGGG